MQRPEPVLTKSTEEDWDSLVDILWDPVYRQAMDHLAECRPEKFRMLLEKGGMPEVQRHCIQVYYKSAETFKKCLKSGMSYEKTNEHVQNKVVSPLEDLEVEEGPLTAAEEDLLTRYWEEVEAVYGEDED